MNATLFKSMLKNFGIDPEEMQARVEGATKKAMDTIENIDKRLGVIEHNQALLLACFDEATLRAAHNRMDKANGIKQSLPALECTKSAGTA